VSRPAANGPVLAGKAVVVTGAGRGLGAAYAGAVAAAGARVVCADLDGSAAERTAGAIGGVPVTADVSDWDAAAALIDTCVDRFGAIDGLVNNAGVVTVAAAAEETEANLRRIIGVNLLGAAFCGTHALRHMTARDSGSIVNVTSGAALGVPRMGAYAASKGGVTALTYAWAAELAGTGVRVNAVSPNARTPLADTLAAAFPDVPAGTASPESNAAAVVYLLSDRASGVQGQVYVTGGETLARQSRPRSTEIGRSGAWTPADVAAAVGYASAEHSVPGGAR
jgi:NAD(P)-dependent dehydrogenase (short-subunit alcohol dehydrogenase family)